MTKRKHSRNFDPQQSLAGLIADLERMTGCRTDGECPHVMARIDTAVVDFKRGLVALYRAEGDSSGVSIMLEDFERVARRAYRHGGKVAAP